MAIKWKNNDMEEKDMKEKDMENEHTETENTESQIEIEIQYREPRRIII